MATASRTRMLRSALAATTPRMEKYEMTKSTKALANAVVTITEFFNEPVECNVRENGQWVKGERNEMRYQQQNVLYWMRVSAQNLLDQNANYRDKIVAGLQGASRAADGTEISIEKIHQARVRLEAANLQMASLEAYIRTLSNRWEKLFPEIEFKMPKKRAPATKAAPSVTADTSLEQELAALKALGVDISGISEPTKQLDERNEEEGVTAG